MLAFVGAKGGVGTTTLAVNVAAALAAEPGASVLVTDLHITGHGDAALFLGVEPRFSIADALENVHRLDRAVLNTLVARAKSGVDVLASPERPSLRHPDPQQLRSLHRPAGRAVPVRDSRYAAVRSRRRGRDRAGVGGHARGQPGTADRAPRRAGGHAAAAALRQGPGRRRRQPLRRARRYRPGRHRARRRPARVGRAAERLPARGGGRQRGPAARAAKQQPSGSAMQQFARKLAGRPAEAAAKAPAAQTADALEASSNHAALAEIVEPGRSARLAISGGQDAASTSSCSTG